MTLYVVKKYFSVFSHLPPAANSSLSAEALKNYITGIFLGVDPTCIHYDESVPPEPIHGSYKNLSQGEVSKLDTSALLCVLTC